MTHEAIQAFRMQNFSAKRFQKQVRCERQREYRQHCLFGEQDRFIRKGQYELSGIFRDDPTGYAKGNRC